CFQVIRLGATPVSLGLLSIQVYASSSEKETSKKELLKIDDLSLYSSPARETKYVEKPQTPLEEGVSHLRHLMEPYTAWCQRAVNFSKIPLLAFIQGLGWSVLQGLLDCFLLEVSGKPLNRLYHDLG
uniref:Apolipoprotein O n=1 Tax=Nothoprocta perdicaria TaxID=30464 RepID=A0A8C6YI00_NOTPE